MMRAGILVLLTLASTVASARGQEPVAPPVEPLPAVKGESPEALVDRLPISLDSIRQQLRRAPDAPSSLRIGQLPTFRVTIYGQRRPLLPDFKESLRQAWQAPIPGGIYNKEILDMITPPQARPFGAFTNGDLAEVAGTALVSALAARALYKGYAEAKGALRSWREERIRREVEAELEAFKRANGLVDPLPQPQPVREPQKRPGGK